MSGCQGWEERETADDRAEAQAQYCDLQEIYTFGHSNDRNTFLTCVSCSSVVPGSQLPNPWNLLTDKSNECILCCNLWSLALSSYT